MKFLKLFSIAIACAFTANASATLNAKAELTIVSAEAITNYLISQDDAVADDFTSNNCATVLATNDDYAISMYTEYSSKKYSAVELKNINGTVIKFQTNPYETQYTLTISNVEGDVKIMKGGVEVTSPLVLNAPADFTVGEIIEFTVSVPYTRDVTSGDWGTICLPWASSALEGATFYKSLGEVDAEKGVALEKVTALEAGKPYVFNATADQIKVTLTGAAAADTIQSGAMVGSFYGCAVPKDMYIIVDNKLYKAADETNTIGANRAYFDVESMDPYTPAPGRRVVFFGGKGATTALEAAEAPAMKDGKMMIDGQLIIIKGGKMFNAQGAAL